jgi:hypothetical protein
LERPKAPLIGFNENVVLERRLNFEGTTSRTFELKAFASRRLPLVQSANGSLLCSLACAGERVDVPLMKWCLG